jgi:hypothetical protein
MRGGWCAALAAAVMLFGASGADAAGDEKVDCSRLSLEFPPAAQADWTECYKLHDSGVPEGEGAEGLSVDFEIIVTDLKSHVVRLVSGDTGQNTYFQKRPVSQIIKEFDELEDIAGTESEEGFKRYQIIRFSAHLWKAPVNCIGFVKYGGGAIGQGGSAMGAGTLLAGYDCWRSGAPDRSQIEATLGAIDD